MGFRATTVTRALDISSSSQATTVLTIGFVQTHYFKVGDVFTVGNIFTFTVATIVNPTTITVTVLATDRFDFTNLQAIIPYFSTNQTGRFTIPYALEKNSGLVQYIVSGTGGASFTVAGSLDKNFPLPPIATVNLPATDGATDSVIVTTPYTYLHFNITSIGVATTLIIRHIG